MKKISCSLIALLATATVAFANTTPIDQLTFSTNSNNEIVITGGDFNITDLNIPSQINGLDVTTIGEYAFTDPGLGNEIIISITLPDSVHTIEQFAFFACLNLTSITLSNNLQTIDRQAFATCISLESITLPDSLQTLGDRAFQNCSSLKSITLPASLQTIGNGAFSVCTSLTNLTIAADNPNYKSINNVLFNKSGTELIQYTPGLPATSYTVPSNVQTIGASAFSQDTHLISITLPDSVKTIEYQAFFDCKALKSITLSDNLQSIGSSAFSGCEALGSITLPNNLQTIGDDAIYNCTALESITLPASVTSIGNRVFSYCSNLASITFLGDAPTVGSTIFRGVASSAKVYVLPAATGFGTTFEGLNVEVIQTDPPSIHAIAHHNDNLLITLNEGTSGITVEETADLTADNWTPISPSIDNGAFQLPTTHTHRYFRFTN